MIDEDMPSNDNYSNPLPGMTISPCDIIIPRTTLPHQPRRTLIKQSSHKGAVVEVPSSTHQRSGVYDGYTGAPIRRPRPIGPFYSPPNSAGLLVFQEPDLHLPHPLILLCDL